ncbi:MAG: hypothetical protein ACI4R9_07280 [Kiritimatiellia bacterium]
MNKSKRVGVIGAAIVTAAVVVVGVLFALRSGGGWQPMPPSPPAER